MSKIIAMNKGKVVEVGLAYHIATREGIQLPPSEPCSRCGHHGNHLVREKGRASIACDHCGKRLPIIFV